MEPASSSATGLYIPGATQRRIQNLLLLSTVGISISEYQGLCTRAGLFLAQDSKRVNRTKQATRPKRSSTASSMEVCVASRYCHSYCKCPFKNNALPDCLLSVSIISTFRRISSASELDTPATGRTTPLRSKWLTCCCVRYLGEHFDLE